MRYIRWEERIMVHLLLESTAHPRISLTTTTPRPDFFPRFATLCNGRQLKEAASQRTTESARQITLVTQQQRTATEQVLQSMRQISGLLTQTVTSAQQTRSAAEVLKALADQLSTVLKSFEAAGGDKQS